MKIKLLLFGAALLLGNLVHAQSDAINTPAMSSKLPPAPNAFELTKYSGLPINLSTGSASSTISLGAVTDGDISVPISLTYNSGNGLKVDQIASRVGMGWVLNAGGVISRTVANRPDEETSLLTVPSALSGTSNAVYDYLDKATMGTAYDSEPDIFSFNFNGYSGQFILQADRSKVTFLTPSPLKVETNFAGLLGDWTLRITDPKGNKYTFGGSTATEKTKSVPLGYTCGKTYDTFIPTAWYLKSIQGYNGGTVNFVYESITFDYYASISQTLIRTPQATALDYYTPASTGTPTLCAFKIDNQTCVSDLRSEGVILIGITSRNASADFSYAARPDVVGDSLLVGVVINNFESGEAYTLTYTNSSNNVQTNPAYLQSQLQTRPFLTKLSRVGGSATEEHKFHYYGMNAIAARMSFSQDYWGYYNGKSNTWFMPQNTDPYIQAIFPTTMANREPDWTYAKNGLLSKIIYPTGGNDSLIYEANTIWDTRMVYPARSTEYLNIQGSGLKTLETETMYINSGLAQNMDLILSCDDGGGTNDGIHQHSIFELYDPSNNLMYTHQLDPGQSVNVTKTLSGAGTYTLVIKSYGEVAIGTVSATFTAAGTSVTANFEAGGVRVAKNISDPGIGNVVMKKIVYAALGTQTRSSGLLRKIPSPNDYYADLPIFSGDDSKQCLYTTAYASPNTSFNYFSGGHIYYRDVIELKSDTWEDGGILHQYAGTAGADPTGVRGYVIPGVSVTNDGIDVGQETAVKTFKTTGGSAGAYTYTIVGETKTHYVSDSRLLLNTDAYSVRRKWTPGNSNPSARLTSEFTAFDVAKYADVRKWVYPDTVTNISYDVNGANPVTNKQVFIYNDTDHLQVNEIQTNMSDGRTSKVKIKYPAEMVAAGVTAPYTTMVNQNRVINEIVKSRYIDTAFMESVITNFDTFASGTIQPKTINYKKGWTTTGEFIELGDYDGDGNLLTQSLKNGPKISYQYNSYGKLIAECKNATAAEFFHQNFESSGTSGTAHTGAKYYAGDYAVTWTRPNSRSYIISYWYLDSGTWKYKEQAYTGSTTLTLGTAIDDVNIFPEDAQMKTYTYVYNTLKSMTDEKGLTTYYEYDSFNRLQSVKDNDGFIVKSYKYHLTN